MTPSTPQQSFHVEKKILPAMLQLNPSRMYEMSAELFNDDHGDDNNDHQRVTKSRRLVEPLSHRDLSSLATNQRKSVHFNSNIATFKSPPPPHHPSPSQPSSSFKSVQIKKITPLKMTNQSIASSDLTRIDANADELVRFGRGFAPCWSPDGRIAIPSFVNQQSNPISQITLQSINLYARPQLERLDIAYYNSYVCVNEKKITCPTFHLKQESRSAAATVDQYIDRRHGSAYERSVWTLIRILFFTESPKKELIEWLRDLVRRDSIELNSKSSDALAFLELTRNEVLKAQSIKQRARDLLSIPQDSNQMNDYKLQIMEWDRTKVRVDDYKLKIYKLLSGDVVAACDDQLSWINQFALHVWYSSRESSVKDLIEMYVNHVNQNLCKSPSSPHVESHLDLRFNLLQIYASGMATSHQDLFHPLSYSKNELDYELGWHVNQILMACDVYKNDYVQCQRDLNYANQLVAHSELEWALFVICHGSSSSSDQNDKKIAIKRNLARLQKDLQIKNLIQMTAPPSDLDSKLDLVRDLKFPMQWVSESRAIRYKYDSNLIACVDEFISCGQFQNALDVILNDLIHDAILSKNRTQASQWLIACRNVNSSDANLYLEFLEILEEESNLNIAEKENKKVDYNGIQNLKMRCVALMQELNEFKSRSEQFKNALVDLQNEKRRATESYMAQVLTSVILGIQFKLEEMIDDVDSEIDAEFLNVAPLSASARLQAVGKLCTMLLNRPSVY
ncbi:nucleoporin Nup96 [Acrasis kona]|uniref:Nucleoporin Nup96 n=1 Tax=Acrasis kona TaxID=1008807 RepID=A0AAW2Z5W5_9EUKA